MFALLLVFTLSQAPSGIWHLFSGEKTPTLSLSPIPVLPMGTSLWHRSVLPTRTAKTLATGYEPTVSIRTHLNGILSLMESTGRRRQVGGGTRLCFPSTLGIQTSAILTLTNDSQVCSLFALLCPITLPRKFWDKEGLHNSLGSSVTKKPIGLYYWCSSFAFSFSFPVAELYLHGAVVQVLVSLEMSVLCDLMATLSPNDLLCDCWLTFTTAYSRSLNPWLHA